MRFLTSKYLIRSVLLLISFQFISPAFIVEPGVQKRGGYALEVSKQNPPGITLSSLFEITENENEEEERDKFITLEYFDITKLHQESLATTQHATDFKNCSLITSGLTLFQLYCNYRI